MSDEHHFIRIIQSILYMICLVIVLMLGAAMFIIVDRQPDRIAEQINEPPPEKKPVLVVEVVWQAPDSTILDSPENKLIAYGRDLVAHTALYLGPNGKIQAISNGMNCQNCHLKSGTKIFGNNYAAVAATYPKFRARSGSIESVEKRVNDCIERSLNGKKLDDNSNEMKAFVAYITWVGKDVQKGVVPKGTGILDLKPLSRPADPSKGAEVYQAICQRCHGAKGEGLKNEDGIEWKYPPVCGNESYNIGAGLYRLSRFAGFVKANMPHGTTYENPVLTDEQAWDVAAFVNSLPRPAKDLSKDWPDITAKPYDHPFGPYADNFSEKEHKYGPFDPIKKKAASR